MLLHYCSSFIFTFSFCNGPLLLLDINRSSFTKSSVKINFSDCCLPAPSNRMQAIRSALIHPVVLCDRETQPSLRAPVVRRHPLHAPNSTAHTPPAQVPVTPTQETDGSCETTWWTACETSGSCVCTLFAWQSENPKSHFHLWTRCNALCDRLNPSSPKYYIQFCHFRRILLSKQSCT